jgi:hypothetical protein
VEADLTASGLRLIPALAVVVAISLGLGMSLTYYVTRKLFKIQGAGSAKQVAVTLGGRGAVGIVIAPVARATDVIDVTAYSLILVSTLAASLIASLLLGRKGIGGRGAVAGQTP